MPFEPGRAKTGGKRRGYKSFFTVAALEKSFKKARKNHKDVSFLDYLANLAYEDHVVAIALFRKLMPDLKTIEQITQVADGLYATLSPAEAATRMDDATVGGKEDG